MASATKINGEIHDWTDVKIDINDEEISGITSINWSSRKDKSLQYASGSAPHGIGYGHRSYSADFTLTLEAAQAFELKANQGGTDALDYAPFSIVVSFADKNIDGSGVLDQTWGGLKVVTLEHVDITDISQSLDEGTQKIVRRYSAVVGKISYNQWPQP